MVQKQLLVFLFLLTLVISCVQDQENLDEECLCEIDFLGPPSFYIEIFDRNGNNLLENNFYDQDSISATFNNLEISDIVNPSFCECPNTIVLDPTRFASITDDSAKLENNISQQDYQIMLNLSSSIKDTLNYTLEFKEVRRRYEILCCGTSLTLISANYNGIDVNVNSNPIPIKVEKNIN